jgi:glycosyltransferase involved in cell wall biosynthesis
LKVGFYTYPEWAFGSIHNALSKELYKYGIIANIVNWDADFSFEERVEIGKIYDVFVTVPGNAVSYLMETYKVPPEKIVAVAHGRYDVEYGIKEKNPFSQFKGFAGVSPDLQRHAMRLGIKRKMDIVKNGVHFDYFYQSVSENMSTVGYGGAFKYQNFSRTEDIKRGYLAEILAQNTNLPFYPSPKRSFLSMPSYYSKVDCVVVPSLQESCSLPLMEAAAAGRLPISTCVGVARDFEGYPGIVLPMNEEKFIREGMEVIARIVKSPKLHKELCQTAQDYARENFDWSVTIDGWVKLLEVQ